MEAALRWFERRQHAIQHLTVHHCHSATDTSLVLTASILRLLHDSLRSLTVTSDFMSGRQCRVESTSALLAALASVPRLERLEVRLDHQQGSSSSSPLAQPDLSALPRLQHLEWRVQAGAAPPGIAALEQLTSLAVGVFPQQQGASSLGGGSRVDAPPPPRRLRQLTLWLDGRVLTSALDRELAFLSSMTGITSLRVENHFGNLPRLPASLTALTHLSTLCLSGNQLGWSTLPPLEALTGLRQLGLARCALRALPPQLSALCQLSVLDLSGNDLVLTQAEVDATLAPLTALTRLQMSAVWAVKDAVPREKWVQLKRSLPRLQQLEVELSTRRQSQRWVI